MCHAKFPDEGEALFSPPYAPGSVGLDSLQQHAETCNDQCPERTELPWGLGVGEPVIVKSSYTPDEGDENQVGCHS